jgi:alkanesulfonate monooxygenase
VLVGSYQQVADQLETWLAAGIDGFNLAYSISPGSFEDFIVGVVPLLQKRGLMQTDYAPGTLREKLYGPGQRLLPATHPAAAASARRAYGTSNCCSCGAVRCARSIVGSR